MTPNKAIEIIDGLLPNAYDEETKLGWISELDGNVKSLVFQDEELPKPYTMEDMDRELLIPFPYDTAYVLYLEAQIHYANREYGEYNNASRSFENRYSEYRKAYIRKYPAKG